MRGVCSHSASSEFHNGAQRRDERARFPRSSPTWLRSAENVLFAALLIAHITPFLVFTYFPSQDGPAHVYNAMALHDYVTSPGGINKTYYELNDTPVANWATPSLMALLIHFVDPLVAEKALLVAYVLFFAFAGRYVLGVFGPTAQSFTVLIFPFIGAWTLHMGFYNFSFSLPLFFLVLASFLRPDAKWDVKRVVGTSTLAALLFLVHPLSFVVALLSVSVMVLWQECLALRERRRSASVPDALGLAEPLGIRRLGAAVLGFAPGVLILLWWAFMSGRSGRFARLELTELWGFLSRLETLVAYVEAEYLWTQALLLVFGVFVLVGIAIRRRNFTLCPSDGLLVLALSLFGLYFASPDWAFGVGKFNYRLLLYPFFPLILWFGAQSWPTRMRIGVQLVGATIALNLLGHHIAAYAHLNGYLEEYVSVADQIQRGRTILPMTLNETTPQLESEAIPDPVWPFLHAAGYVAAARRGVYLNNFEALLGTFPLRFRPEVNPNDHIGRVGNIPPDVTLAGYGEKTPGSLDYILLWKVGPWSRYMYRDRQEYERITSSWDEQLQRGFEIASVSAEGHMTLWRARRLGDR
jgi:hypothetical protein